MHKLILTPLFARLRADVLYLPQEVDWVKFNVDMSGYYMVHYLGDGWNAIINLLQHHHMVLTSNDRASLIHDVFQLVRSVRRSGTTSRTRSLSLMCHVHSCVFVAAWGR